MVNDLIYVSEVSAQVENRAFLKSTLTSATVWDILWGTAMGLAEVHMVAYGTAKLEDLFGGCMPAFLLPKAVDTSILG